MSDEMSDEEKNLPDVAGGKSRISLIHIDARGLSGPGKLLIEKVSNGIGAVVRPFLTVVNAKAETKAAAILAEGQFEITDIQRRGLERLAHEEGKRQQNMESITAKAIPDLADGAKPDEIEDDWIAHFFDRCRLISDEEAQTAWGKILSGEANEPGSFSRRTIDILSTMNKEEAENFSTVCKFIWISGKQSYAVIHDHNADVYKKAGLYYSDLVHLVSIGLLQESSVAYFIDNRQNLETSVQYFDKTLILTPKGEFPLGYVFLTASGAELSKICHAEADWEYFDIIFGWWIKEECRPVLA